MALSCETTPTYSSRNSPTKLLLSMPTRSVLTFASDGHTFQLDHSLPSRRSWPQLHRSWQWEEEKEGWREGSRRQQ